jgi:hypothetical protein
MFPQSSGIITQHNLSKELKRIGDMFTSIGNYARNGFSRAK